MPYRGLAAAHPIHLSCRYPGLLYRGVIQPNVYGVYECSVTLELAVETLDEAICNGVVE